MTQPSNEGVVPFRRIFGDDTEIPEDRLETLLQNFYEVLYVPIETSLKEAVKEELSNVFVPKMKELGLRENIHRRNLEARGVVPPPMTWTSANAKTEKRCDKCRNVVRVKTSNGTVTIQSHRSLASRCVHLEKATIGERLKMAYYVHVEKTIDSEDCKQLSHAFYKFGRKAVVDKEKAAELSQLLHSKFADGIHGLAKQTLVSSPLVCFQMLRNCLETRLRDDSGVNPDFIYYALYRMFPRSGSQEDFSKMFPELCKAFAEPGFDPLMLESWKCRPEPKIARNLRHVECYDCLSYMCAVHGFRPEVPAFFGGGNFKPVKVPLPLSRKSRTSRTSSGSSDDDVVCPCEEYGPCWKSTRMQDVRHYLTPTRKDKEQGFVMAYFNKHSLVEMPSENGAEFLSFFPDTTQTLCEFAQIFVELNAYPSIACCQDAYKLILENIVFPDEDEVHIGQPNGHLTYSERLQNFGREKQRQERAAKAKRDEELKRRAETEQRALAELIAEHEREERNKESIRMRVHVPYKPCMHAGPCSTAEDCACRVNGTCYHGCHCSDDCPQKFPGCNCAPGKCDTRQCSCHRAQWECSPLTCKNCGCADVDSEFGAQTSCKNFEMTRMVMKKLEVRQSLVPGAGNGLFAGEPIKKNELVVEYVGERISEEEVERRGACVDLKKCSYIFNLEGGGGIDAAKIGNVSRFANHNHRNPNLWPKNVVVNGENRIGLYAKRDLVAGEELTFNYNYSKEQREAYFGK